MKTYKRICIRDFEIRDDEGTRFELRRGQEYITSEVGDDGTLTVFSDFWVPIPENIFAGAEVFTD